MKTKRLSPKTMIFYTDVKLIKKTPSAYLMEGKKFQGQWIPRSVVSWATENSFWITKWARDRFLTEAKATDPKLSRERYDRETEIMKGQRPIAVLSQDISRATQAQLNLG